MFDQPAAPPETAQHDAPPCGVGFEAGAVPWARPLLERQLGLLGQLAEIGLAIAQALERQATAAAAGSGDGPPGSGEDGLADGVIRVVQGDVALAYGRVARAVRLTLALQSKLIGDLRAFDHFAPLDDDKALRAARNARKARVERIVGRVIDAEHDAADAVERLQGQAYERLVDDDDDDVYGDVLTRPISEIVALICRDLGLSPDWPRLAEEAWAREEIQGGAPGSPLAALMARGADALQPTAASDPFRLAPHAGSP